MDAILKGFIDASVPALAAVLVALAGKAWAWIDAKAKAAHLDWMTSLAAQAVAAARQNGAIIGNLDMKAYAVGLLTKRGVSADIADALVEAAYKAMSAVDKAAGASDPVTVTPTAPTLTDAAQAAVTTAAESAIGDLVDAAIPSVAARIEEALTPAQTATPA